jgi:NAD-dependent dihydropyrimidine dehydrogenase PreA subunit
MRCRLLNQLRAVSTVDSVFNTAPLSLLLALTLATLKEEAIYPYTEDEMQVVKSIEGCINCGLCIQHCPVVAAVGLDRFSGPRSIAVELSRSPPEYWTTAS